MTQGYPPTAEEMESRTSTPKSRSPSSTGSYSSSDTTMMDAPPQSPSRPARLRHHSQSLDPTSVQQPASPDPTFSLLLSLPRELRDRVYLWTLTSPEYFAWPNRQAQSQKPNAVGVNLLRANKQVYDEAVPVLYRANKFLFTHPSDCNIFRVIAAPASKGIQSVYFRIREKDLRLWTSYLGSKSPDRSLQADLPMLKSLWIFMRCGSMGTPAMLGQLGAAPGLQGIQGLPPGVQMQVQAAQNALGQQIQALGQQVQNLSQVMANAGAVVHPPPAPQVVTVDPNSGANANQIPPPPPPGPPAGTAMPFLQFAQGALGLGGQGHHHHHPPPAVPHQHGTHNNPPNPSPLAQHLAQNQTVNIHALPPPSLQHPPTGPFHGSNFPALIPPAQPVQPAPAHGHQHTHTHTLYSFFLRFEREMGLEALCLSLQDTLTAPSSTDSGSSSSSPSSKPRALPTEVRIVCIMRIPRREVERLVRLFPDELSVDGKGDARTSFRKLHGVEVSVELSGYPLPAVEVEEGA